MSAPEKSADYGRDLFEETFSFYAKGLLIYAREFVSSQEEAEDIVSDIFVNLWEKIDTISVDTIKYYLFNSTRNRCLNYLSYLKVRSDYQGRVLRENNMDYLSSDLFIETELRQYLNAAIERLSARQREIFIMNKIYRRSYSEIAVELDISPKTVDNHLQSAYKMLRKCLPKDILTLS